MNDYALFDQLMGASAPAAPYAPYGLDEWGNPLPEPQIPTAIQTTAPVAQQAQQDYTQAINAAFDWTPPAPALPALPEMQGASYSPVGNAAANLAAQFGEDTNTFDGAQQAFDPWAALLQFEQAGTGTRSSGLEGYGGDFNAAAPASPRGVTQLQLQQTLSDIGRAEQAGTISPAEAQRQYKNVMGRSTPTGPNLDPYPLAGKAVGAGLDVLGDIVSGKYIQGYTGVAGQGAIGPAPARAPMSAKDVYNIADMPSDIAKQQAINLIGDNPYGRIAGEALNIGLAPETLASLGIAGASPLANAIGRGSMKTAPYLTSLVGSQVANDIAREAGAPVPVQLWASVLGAIGGAGIPAAATLGVAGTRVAAQAAARESAARVAAQAATSRRLANILPDSVLTNARIAAINANKQGLDPVAAARDTIRGTRTFRIAGAAEPTPEEIEAVAKMIADLNLPEGKMREAVKGLPRAYGTWTPEEDAMIRTLKQMGWGDQAIAAGMGRESADVIAARYQRILLSEGRQAMGLDDVPPIEGYGGGIEDEAARAIRTGGAINVPTGQQNQQAFGDFVQQAAANPQVENPSRMGPLLEAGPSPGGPLKINAPLTPLQRLQAANMGWGGPGDIGRAVEPPQKKDPFSLFGVIERIGNENRQAGAGFDISNFARQGKVGIVRRWSSMKAALSDVWEGRADEATRLAINANNKTSPVYARARKAGIFISDMAGEGAATINKREETYAGEIVGNLPGYKQTGQANTLLINKLRLDSFNTVTNAWDRAIIRAQEPDASWWTKKLASWAQRPDADASLANYINRETGRGTLKFGSGKLDLEGTEIDKALGFTFFSPRFQLSRPQAAMNIFNFKQPAVAVEAWKDFMADFGVTTSLLMLADQSGVADVELDPRSSDFGKFKIGNTRVDPWSGYQQMATLTARLLSGERLDAIGKVSDADLIQTLGAFGRGKLAPLPSTALDQYLGEDLLGRKADVTSIGLSLLPMYLEGLYQAAQDGLLGEAAMTIPLEMLGLGASTYLPSVNQQLEAAANKLNPAIPWAEMGRAEKREFVMQNPSLTDKWQAAEAAREGESVRLQRERDAALDRIAPLATNDPEAYRAKVSDIIGDYNTNREYAIEKGIIKPWGEPESELGKAMDGFYKAADEARTIAGTDYDLREKLTSDYLATLSPEMRERVLKELTFATEPHYGALLRDRQVITPYWEIRDNAWRNLAAANEIFAGSTSEESWRATKIAQEMADGRSEEIATKIADAFINAYAAQAKVEQIMYLYNNRDVLVLLDRWGYSIPTGLTALLPYYAQQLRGTTPEQRQFEMAGQR